MGGATMNGGGGARRGRRGGYRPMADINVTPLVDVMLVLLIVFMIAAPMLTVAVPVDLPKAQGKTISNPDNKPPLIISVDKTGVVYLQETPTEMESLVPKLKAITGINPDARIFVRGDKGVAYGRIMEVMGTVSAAGYTKVSLVAEPPKSDLSKGTGR